MKLVIVRPLNDTNGRKYLFESEFGDTPYTAKNIKPGAIVHCETCFKKGMYGEIMAVLNVSEEEKEETIKFLKLLDNDITLPLKKIDIVYAEILKYIGADGE
jgi:hypothetical protein